MGDTTSLVPGFPIRTSSDPRSVDNSPRHIAASHVLHRLPVPRHPPCALTHLQHKNQKMSHPHMRLTHARAKQNCTSTHNSPTNRTPACQMLATTIHNSNTTPHHQSGATTKPYPRFPTTGRRDSGPVASKPNSVSGDSITGINPEPAQRLLCTQPAPLQPPTPSRPDPHQLRGRFRGAP